ncbi:MAG: DsrE family protein [Anaerolineaceae bacterium]
MTPSKDIVYIIPAYGMGISAETDLPLKLIKKFLLLQKETQKLHKALCLFTDGVKLACLESPVIEELRGLEAAGVRIILCQTCLEFFNLIESVEVGIIGSMGDIIEAMQQADSVITLS